MKRIIGDKHTPPNPSRHYPNPAYIKELISRTGLSQQAAARAIGVSPRIMRYYLAGKVKIPYPVQYALESLPGKNIVSP